MARIGTMPSNRASRDHRKRPVIYLRLQERITTGRIAVRTVARMSSPFEEVLDLYGLQEGDKAVVRLALQAADVEATITDDRLLYVVLHRCGHQALFSQIL